MTADDATHVVAQGTFDLLHPGHVHYLRDAAAMGDRLTVIVARRENVTHKETPVLPNRQRRDVVAAIDAVDDARVGHPADIFAPIEELDPDVIALGHDQHHDEAAIEDELARRGVDCEVRRSGAREPEYEGELLSTGRIIDRILEERG
ncbi:adenylyltransferase/cytidyltransferase family protein [Halorussus litoreus]|uniref:adenylyltransferase/cytidyltransferase family protein n=1 Tax=Halorussus litoreus TaxID=1710536 RepID=UPI000E228170|nr:adenylyltransferase/cytidyltransferase family protein [Halorussus litoreus]